MDASRTAPVAPANLEQQRSWDGHEGSFWAAHADQFDAGVRAYHARLLDAAAITATDRVLDIGCGAGQTTRDAARRAPRGGALGVDLSGPMLAVARGRARAEGVGNVTFERADAQVHPFEPGGFDVALSRNGCMFFGDPPAAFRNIARAVRGGGRLALAVWQPVARNEWFTSLATALAAGRSLPSPPPDAPGPFALGDPDRAGALLTAAGFTDPRFEDVRAPMYFGANPASAHAFVAEMLDRLVKDLDDDARRGALDALRETLQAHATADDGVLLGSAMWLVTAGRA